ncbi:conserved hypothetical protein [Leishmania infantum JPCM5]|uniref:Chaperone_protein_DNAj_-_putative n=2 Tax=Leishmania infantum TaxID=5671 RepID=A0A6L0XSC6_LEIIN|nr:conserved hypothetical protein [Leishmania infantum JPCM5]CAC9546522.1 chaperone_protein_DNAj_-_putative [Leishmania infantum]CAM72314.1 conserved hypothetical protein [Leishmania infantum JPCM5]SUZ46233.1 chaperone_protein_DNAj_-_putative [Leishmania infantum]|eukprot:XP_001469211.1 conserved hypothetical protein [Leishmania infantum JPCM5]
MLKDYYAILDVLPHASGEEIRRAFKRLALQFHPDKMGGGAATELTSTVDADRHRVAAKRDENASANASVARSNAAAASCQPLSRDFTDIQEAYEVLGDVARRYLYDMNYQELLAVQQQRQQEERKRCDSHARAVAEAARQARERERLQQQQQSPQPRNINTFSTMESIAAGGLRANAPGSSPPQHGAPHTLGRGAEDIGAASPTLPPDDAPQRRQPCQKLAPAEKEKDGDCSLRDLERDAGGGGGLSQARCCFTAPTRPREVGSRPKECRAKRHGCERDTNERLTSSHTQRRLSCADTKHARQHMAATVPAMFVLSSSLPFSWGETSAQTCPSVVEPSGSRGRQWHRHTAPRNDGETEEPELPMEYYYQRSIERTLRVFFSVPHAE